MEKKTFDIIRDIVYENSGITLGDNKDALVGARVGKRMRALGLKSADEYLDILLADKTGSELVHLLDAISTNVTSFYREPNHFKFLADIFVKWQEEGQRRFRFWCAASSTGEEPYTIALTLLENTRFPNLDIKILATDISTRVLDKCLEGVYHHEKVKTIPPDLLTKHFTKAATDKGPGYRVKDQLKNMIVFKRLNLSVPPFPMKGPLDIVFCRNVMIYFDNKVRKALLDEVYRLLKPDGYLIVGHAESLTGMIGDFKVIKPSIYVKK